MMDALGVAVNRLFNYIESLCGWIFKKHKGRAHVDHFEWNKTYMPDWVKRESYQFVKRRKHIKYKKMYLRGRHWEYKVYYRKNGSIYRCVRKLRWGNNKK